MCTTQPIMRCAMCAAASRRPDRASAGVSPSYSPPWRSKYHHGSPLIAGSTVVSASSSGAMRGSDRPDRCDLSAMKTSPAARDPPGPRRQRAIDAAGSTDIVDELQAVATDCVEVRAARQQRHLVARWRELGADRRADAASADDRDLHRPSLTSANVLDAASAGPSPAPAFDERVDEAAQVGASLTASRVIWYRTGGRRAAPPIRHVARPPPRRR